MNNAISHLALDITVDYLQSTVPTSTTLNQIIYCNINCLRALRVVARQPEEVLPLKGGQNRVLGCNNLALFMNYPG